MCVCLQFGPTLQMQKIRYPSGHRSAIGWTDQNVHNVMTSELFLKCFGEPSTPSENVVGTSERRGKCH